MMVVRFLLGTFMLVSLAWLIASPSFAPAMMLAVSFSGLAALSASPTQEARMEI